MKIRFINLSLAAALGGLLIASSAAQAVVQGTEGAAISSSALMVLNARGGVCSGVVIAPDAVLTAGHCVAGGAELRIHFRDSAGQPVLLTPRSMALHPEFRSDAASARRRSVDLALVRLAEPLPGFSPATLSPGNPAAGETVEVAGFGMSREGEARSSGILRAATLAVIEPYGPSRILLWAADARGRGKTPASGACQGDSGGPLSDEAGVVAITSWSTGAGKAKCGLITQGILLGPQRGWIDRTLSAWGATARWFTKP